MTNTQQLRMSPKQRQEAIEWFSECYWPDADENDFQDLSDLEIEKYIDKHFCGGITEFIRISNNAA